MCLLSIDNYPPPASMESLLREQLETVPRFSTRLEYYMLKYPTAQKNYDELYSMVLHFIDEERLHHNKKSRAQANQRWTASQNDGGNASGSTDPQKPKRSCAQFGRTGKCSYGDKCSFNHVHNPARDKSKSRGRRGDSAPAPRKPSADKRGVSPSGKVNRPTCRSFARTGKCDKPKGQCDFWHPIMCRFFKHGTCTMGDKCPFAHCKPEPGQSGGTPCTSSGGKGKGKAKSKSSSPGGGRSAADVGSDGTAGPGTPPLSGDESAGGEKKKRNGKKGKSKAKADCFISRGALRPPPALDCQY